NRSRRRAPRRGACCAEIDRERSRRLGRLREWRSPPEARAPDARAKRRNALCSARPAAHQARSAVRTQPPRTRSGALRRSSAPAARRSCRLLLLRPLGQREIERRSASGLGLRPDASAVPLDDLLDDGETHAHAFELARLVQSLEYTEELAGVTHVEAHAVVAHEVDALTRPL